MIRILIGLPLFLVFVLLPVIASGIATVAKNTGIDIKSVYLLAHRAAKITPICNPQILELAGDSAMTEKMYSEALYAYAKAIECAPNQALLRAKYGYIMQYSESKDASQLENAQKMEPNNPIFKAMLVKK